MNPELYALAPAFVRPLIEALCAASRDAASRVVAKTEHGRPDPEAIHDHRVALRRLRTLLAACDKLFKRRALSRVQEGLRDLAKAAGAVRDEEVLAETLGKLDLPDAIRTRVDAWLVARAPRQRELRAAVIQGLTREGDEPSEEGEGTTPEKGAARSTPAPALFRRLELAEALPLRRRAAALSTRAVALRAIEDAAERTLAQAARPDAATPDGQHRLRIRWKRLRYTAELFSKAFAKDSPAFAALAQRVKTATRMQKRLGELHDVDEAIAAVSRAERLDAGDRMVLHHRLRACRGAMEARLAKELPAALSLLSGGDAAGPLA
jgi:CHAD domain-containing protein